MVLSCGALLDALHLVELARTYGGRILVPTGALLGLDAVFEGTAREAARGFPANLHVAAALSLAGLGPDRTRLEIWADPGVTRNVHTIELDSDAVRLSMTIENIPSANPKTGRITALSVIAMLRKMRAPLAVGT